MKKADREARRQRIQAIEQAEAHARCAWCKAPLLKRQKFTWDMTDDFYCSVECLLDVKDDYAGMLGRRRR